MKLVGVRTRLRARLVTWRRSRAVPLWAVPLAVLLLAIGCGGDSYPIDFFPEMHYQASFRSQEPPRLAPPAESVPVTGKERQYTAGQLANMRNPVALSSRNIARGKQLFLTNCAMCHGTEGKGDGPVAEKFKANNATTVPADLSLPATQDKAPGLIWSIVTNGGLNMPTFRYLLTEEQRWLLVLFIEEEVGTKE